MSTIKKPESNYMVFNFNLDYDGGLVLPYKDGLAMLAALENAKVFKQSYNTESKIADVVNSSIKTSSIGAQEYGEAILRSTLLAEDASK